MFQSKKNQKNNQETIDLFKQQLKKSKDRVEKLRLVRNGHRFSELNQNNKQTRVYRGMDHTVKILLMIGINENSIKK